MSAVALARLEGIQVAKKRKPNMVLLFSSSCIKSKQEACGGLEVGEGRPGLRKEIQIREEKEGGRERNAF